MMTARTSRHTVRTPRPAPPGRGAIPSAAVRRRRGPRPPDGVTLMLHEALRDELAGAGRRDGPETSPAPTLGARWRAALRRALGAIVLLARRGVAAALGGAARAAATTAPPAPPSEAEDPTPEVEAAITHGRAKGHDGATVLAAATTVAAGWVLREHARQVEAVARAAGVSKYVWTTEHDDRVRELHRELEGTTHTWDAPPISGSNGFRGHPGEPAQCRCQAWPITPR